jgi:hypothetical protein
VALPWDEAAAAALASGLAALLALRVASGSADAGGSRRARGLLGLWVATESGAAADWGAVDDARREAMGPPAPWEALALVAGLSLLWATRLAAEWAAAGDARHRA